MHRGQEDGSRQLSSHPHCPLCDSESQLLDAVWADAVPISVPVSNTEPNWEISRNVIERLRIKMAE